MNNIFVMAFIKNFYKYGVSLTFKGLFEWVPITCALKLIFCAPKIK